MPKDQSKLGEHDAPQLFSNVGVGVVIELDGWDDLAEVADEESGSIVLPAAALFDAPVDANAEQTAGQNRCRSESAFRDRVASRRILAGVKAIVADADPLGVEAVATVLRDCGSQVEVAHRGLQLMRQIKAVQPHLVVVDAGLPELHGFTVAERLRSHGRYSHISILLLSSFYRGWRVARDLRRIFHVDDLLEKPVDPLRLVTAAEHVLRRRLGKLAPKRRHMIADARLHYRRSLQHANQGEVDLALAACREALAIDPLPAVLYLQLGVLLLKKPGLVYQAMQAFEQALQVDPGCFPAVRFLATLYEEEGLTNMAVDMWERALRLSPDEAISVRIRKHLLTLV